MEHNEKDDLEEGELNEDDDLEEGELKDDDDDDEVDDEDGDKSDGEASRLRTSSSEEESPKRTACSPSVSCSAPPSPSPLAGSPTPSNDSKERSSSKNSSRIGSHLSSSSRNNSSISDKYQSNRLSSARHLSEDKYRVRDRDRNDQTKSEKAAKLISMRTRLLEARSREIELKFQKNKVKLSSPPPPVLSPTIDQRIVKMTVARPSISYSENPNPPLFMKPAVGADESGKEVVSEADTDKEKEKKRTRSKQKHVSKEKKQKKKSKKKKKKSSSKKRKKSKSSNSVKKLAIEPKPETSPELKFTLDNNKPTIDHQGPRTPPDNHVMTLDDEQIEWPSHLIKTTSTEPPITYSVNPDSIIDSTNGDIKRVFRRRKSTLTSPVERKRYKIVEKYMSVSSPPHRTLSPFTLKTDVEQSTQKYSYPRPYETDLNFDYRWYYNYFVNSLEMDHNQAQHQAYYSIISAGSYEQETLDRWLISRGFIKQSSPICDDQKSIDTPTLEEVITTLHESRHSESTKDEDRNVSEEQELSSAEAVIKTEDANDEITEKPLKSEGYISSRPLKPEITIFKSQKEIVLPDGQVLPAGTIQKIVHPYPKLESELLGPYFDFF